MERPVVIWHREIPSLRGQPVFGRVAINIGDARPHLLNAVLIEGEGVGAPDGVLVGTKFSRAQQFSRKCSQSMQGDLGRLAVAADEQMDVIGEDGAGVAGEAIFLNNLRDRLGDGSAVRLLKPEDRMLQLLFRSFVERPQLLARGLYRFATEMNFAQRSELHFAQFP